MEDASNLFIMSSTASIFQIKHAVMFQRDYQEHGRGEILYWKRILSNNSKGLGTDCSLGSIWHVTVTPKGFVSTYGYSRAFSLYQSSHWFASNLYTNMTILFPQTLSLPLTERQVPEESIAWVCLGFIWFSLWYLQTLDEACCFIN